MKDLNISDSHGARANIPDLKIFGDPDAWVCVCKASSQQQGWMKSTKRMAVPGGWLYQVTTQQRNHDGTNAVAEALAFVPIPSGYLTSDGEKA